MSVLVGAPLLHKPGIVRLLLFQNRPALSVLGALSQTASSGPNRKYPRGEVIKTEHVQLFVEAKNEERHLQSNSPNLLLVLWLAAGHWQILREN